MTHQTIEPMLTFKSDTMLNAYLESYTKSVNKEIKAIEKEKGVEPETGFIKEIDTCIQFASRQRHGHLLFQAVPFTLRAHTKGAPILLFHGMKPLLDYIDQKLKDWHKNPTKEHLDWMRNFEHYAEILRYVPHAVAHYEYKNEHEYNQTKELTPESVDESFARVFNDNFSRVFDNWYTQFFYIETESVIYTVNRNALRGTTDQWNGH